MNYIENIKLHKDDNYQVIVEVLKNTKDKTELLAEEFNHLEKVFEVKYKYPYYYGSFPETLADDEDPLDFILLSDKKHNYLDIIEVEPIAMIKTIDENKGDYKILVKDKNENLKHINKRIKSILSFLNKCTKNNNTIIDNNIYDKEKAIEQIEHCYKLYKINKEQIIKTF